MHLISVVAAVVALIIASTYANAADCTKEKPKDQIKCLQDKIVELEKQAFKGGDQVSLRSVAKGECINWMTEKGEIKSGQCDEQHKFDIWQLRRK